MKRYLIKRFVILLVTAFLVSLFVFFLVQKQPGNPYLNAMKPGMTKEMMEQYLKQKGYYDPFFVKYLKWIRDIFHLDMGYSIQYKKPVWDLIVERVPNTLRITIPSFLLAFLLSPMISVYCAYKKDGIVDRIITFFTTCGICIPTFLIAIIFIKILGFEWKLFPISGVGTEGVNSAKHFVLPILTFTFILMASFIRYVREFLLKEKEKLYILQSRVKGRGLFGSLLWHAMPNIWFSYLTMGFMEIPSLFAGAVITETVFVIPGIGKLNYDAIYMQDYPVIMGVLTISIILVLGANLCADLIPFYEKERIHEEH